MWITENIVNEFMQINEKKDNTIRENWQISLCEKQSKVTDKWKTYLNEVIPKIYQLNHHELSELPVAHREDWTPSTLLLEMSSPSKHSLVGWTKGWVLGCYSRASQVEISLIVRLKQLASYTLVLTEPLSRRARDGLPVTVLEFTWHSSHYKLVNIRPCLHWVCVVGFYLLRKIS